MAHWFYSIRSKSFHFFSLSSLQYTVQYFTDVLASTASILHLFIISLNLPMYCTSWPLFHRCSGLYSLYPPPVYHLPGPTYVLHDLYFTDVLASTASILHLCIISLDRYWAITNPFSYPIKMSDRWEIRQIPVKLNAEQRLSYNPKTWGLRIYSRIGAVENPRVISCVNHAPRAPYNEAFLMNCLRGLKQQQKN